ncbi:MAG: hypothetical protein QNJ71_11280 [Acidimicrobiia bacterium]|nr:hypothetical protein [Acidimicrobiia bacterium]
MANTFDLPTEGCETQIVAPNMPCATHNLCVLGLDQRIYRMAQELTKQQSARVTGIMEKDKARFDQYYTELLGFANAAGNNPQDFHYLVEYSLAPMINELPPVENESINAVMGYLLGADLNLRVSQSTRLNDGLLPQDLEDFTDAVNKSKELLDTAFGSTLNPMDMPQSAPSQPVRTPS